jgi:hypothetical protein
MQWPGQTRGVNGEDQLPIWGWESGASHSDGVRINAKQTAVLLCPGEQSTWQPSSWVKVSGMELAHGQLL